MKFLRNEQYEQCESNTITIVLLSHYQYTLNNDIDNMNLLLIELL